MNKLFLFFLLSFFSHFVQAQDSLFVPQKIEISQNKKVQIDTNSIVKTSFTKNFKSHYQDAELVYEYKSSEKNSWERFKDWLTNLIHKLFDFSDKNNTSDIIDIILKVLAFCIVAFVIYLIVKAIIKKEGQWIFGKDSLKKNMQYSEIENNIHATDFEKLIKESNLRGNKRLSIRYYYLWVLKTMTQNHYIKWDIEKTNSDYLSELQNPKHKEEFSAVSYLYDYIWYGEFEIDATTFEKAENQFKKALITFSNG